MLKISFCECTALSFSDDRRTCEPCPTLKDIVDDNGKCATCAEGSFPNGLRNSCSQCQVDEKVDFDGSCKKCPHGFVPDEFRRHCKPCPKSLIAEEGVCNSCPNPEKE